MIPALTNGVKKNVSQKDGLEGLLQALNKGNHDRYLDDPGALQTIAAVDDGNGILGHIFGSKDTSRALAKRTSKTTGISADILKKMLPLIAGLVMGSLKKQGGNSGLLDQLLGSLTGGDRSIDLGRLWADCWAACWRRRSTSSSAAACWAVCSAAAGKRRLSSSPLDALTGLLDADGEGSAIDDILGWPRRCSKRLVFQ